MQIAIVSDVHSHPWREFSYTLKNGRNSRFQNTLNVWRRIRRRCVKEGIRVVICAGDLFHKKGLIPISVYNAVYEELDLFNEAGITVYIVPGNHDQATLDGKVHALTALRKIVNVVETPQRIALHKHVEQTSERVTVAFVPYMEDAKAFKKAIRELAPADILIAHGGIQGAVTGPVEYRPEEEITPEDVPTSYGFRLFGHYHHHQKLGVRLWYIGSPMQQDKGERKSKKKGFLIYDTKTQTFRKVRLGFPEFKVVNYEKLVKSASLRKRCEDNYVYVNYKPSEISEEKVYETLEACGAEGVKPVPIVEGKVKAQRLDVDPTLHPNVLVTKYIEKYADAEDQDELKKLASEYLGMVS